MVHGIQSLYTYTDTSFNGYDSGVFETIFELYLTEDELDKLITEKIQPRMDSATFKSFIRAIVSNRKFSEEFLVKHIEHLDEYTIRKEHSLELNTQMYSQIVLYFQVNK